MAHRGRERSLSAYARLHMFRRTEGRRAHVPAAHGRTVKALAFFVYGFAKSIRENLRRDELATFRRLADPYLALDRTGLAAAQAVGAIVEVKCDDQAVQE